MVASPMHSVGAENLTITPAKAWWLFTLLVCSAVFWLLMWYGDTVGTMVATWTRSETFAHGFLIVPISAWLIWRKRHLIASLPPRPNFWMLLPLAVVSLGWLLGELTAVVVVQQYGLVLMLLFLVAAIVGTQIAKELAFPLLFLLFAVPFGEVLLPTLMEHTADFAVFALRLTGIPVYREGLYFSVPSGNWSVVEACSGLRYLIASVTLGVLYAYLTYSSIKRRVIFITLSVVVPILANWFRAYMIVMIGHLSSMKHAVGVDHLIYGWLFFGVVMLILFWVGSFWREDDDVESSESARAPSALIERSTWVALISGVAVCAAAVTVAPIFAAHLENRSHQQAFLQVPSGDGTWRATSGSLGEWSPHYMNPSARVSQAYESGPRRAELYVGYYRNQRQNAELIASNNVLVHSNDKVWGAVSTSQRSILMGNNKVHLMETIVRSHNQRLLLWHWYWVDGRYTANPYQAKLLQAISQLAGRGDDAAVIVASTPIDTDVPQAASNLADFIDAMRAGIAQTLLQTRSAGLSHR